MTNELITAFRALRTPAGQELLTALDPAEVAADPLGVATRLRRQHSTSGSDTGAPPDVPRDALINAALTQARLRGRARAKFGVDAAGMYFTAEGLEQSSRRAVAEYRARRIASGVGTGALVADLCCGIGGDLLGMAEAGLRVEGVEADPFTAAVAAANIDARGLSSRARVREGDAASVAPRGYDAVFCDPARRGKGGRVFDPNAYAPTWPAVVELARSAPAGCVKAAPGIPHDLIPHDAGTEWISVDGEVKEATLWFGTLSDTPRRATMLSDSGGTPASLTATDAPTAPPVASPGRYLYEPDGAVIRAHLVARAAREVDGALLDPRIAYITSDRLVDTPFCRAYEVTEVLPFSVKRLRAALRERGAGTVTIKKRGSAVDVAKLRRDLKPRGPSSAVVVLTRVGERPICLLCAEVRAAR